MTPDVSKSCETFYNVLSRAPGWGCIFLLILGWKTSFSADVQTEWDSKISLAIFWVVERLHYVFRQSGRKL